MTVTDFNRQWPFCETNTFARTSKRSSNLLHRASKRRIATGNQANANVCISFLFIQRQKMWMSKLFRNVPIITHERMSPLLLVVLSLFAPAGERDAGRPERSEGRPEARSPAGRPRASAVPWP